MTSTPEMVERVARALAKQEGYAYDRFPYEERAIAAIEAMRKPTAAMLEAGPGDPYLDDDVWDRIIDSALGRKA